MIIISVFLIIFIAKELAIFITYGLFVSKEVTDTFMNLDEKGLFLNMYDNSILHNGNNMYMIGIHSALLSKYNIETCGTVPRWSKLHKKINEYYEVARKNN